MQLQDAVNKVATVTLPYLPKAVVQRFSRRYIAGETVADAFRVCRSLISDGACVTLDILGEDVRRLAEAARWRDEYVKLLQNVAEEGIAGNVSVKPTQMGLKLDKEQCFANYRQIVGTAAELSNFVRIDMEDHTCTDDTIELFIRLRREFRNVGLVLQAYLRRCLADVGPMMESQENIRLCKGIYVEPRRIAYKDKEIIRRSYVTLLDKMLQAGCYVGIATHDEHLVFEALAIVDRLRLSPEQYEFQMLLGVDRELREIIIGGGHRLRVYVPYGVDWYPYSMRRLKENPAIVGHIMRNLLHPDREGGAPSR